MAYCRLGKAISFLMGIVLLTVLFPNLVRPRNDRAQGPSHQCGCPKEKVDSHTCCCTLSQHRCCGAHAVENASTNTPNHRTSPTPTFCRARCAQPGELLTGSSGKTTFVVAFYLYEVVGPNSYQPQTTGEKPEDLFLEVSVPPPENNTSRPIQSSLA